MIKAPEKEYVVWFEMYKKGWFGTKKVIEYKKIITAASAKQAIAAGNLLAEMELRKLPYPPYLTNIVITEL